MLMLNLWTLSSLFSVSWDRLDKYGQFRHIHNMLWAGLHTIGLIFAGDGQIDRDILGQRHCDLPYAVFHCVSVCSQAHFVLYFYDFAKFGKSGPQGFIGDFRL